MNRNDGIYLFNKARFFATYDFKCRIPEMDKDNEQKIMLTISKESDLITHYIDGMSTALKKEMKCTDRWNIGDIYQMREMLNNLESLRRERSEINGRKR